MSLNENINELGIELYNKIESLNPKYLAEIIQIKPYEGNEDLPKKLEILLRKKFFYAS